MKYKYNNFAIEAYFYEIQSSFVFIENVFNKLTTIKCTKKLIQPSLIAQSIMLVG